VDAQTKTNTFAGRDDDMNLGKRRALDRKIGHGITETANWILIKPGRAALRTLVASVAIAGRSARRTIGRAVETAVGLTVIGGLAYLAYDNADAIGRVWAIIQKLGRMFG
jgi:exopolysaccharide biosynthesis protein